MAFVSVRYFRCLLDVPFPTRFRFRLPGLNVLKYGSEMYISSQPSYCAHQLFSKSVCSSKSSKFLSSSLLPFKIVLFPLHLTYSTCFESHHQMDFKHILSSLLLLIISSTLPCPSELLIPHLLNSQAGGVTCFQIGCPSEPI
jgi:hypothetical protein